MNQSFEISAMLVEYLSKYQCNWAIYSFYKTQSCDLKYMQSIFKVYGRDSSDLKKAKSENKL